MTPKTYELYFDDPRLRMTIGGRFLVRVVSYVSYLFIVAAFFTLFFSGIRPLQSLGALIALFLIDYFLHFREADSHLTELPSGEALVNAARYLSPAAFSHIEHAYQRSSFSRGNFFVELAVQLLGVREIREGINRLDVKPTEFKEKAEELLRAEDNREKITKDERRAKVALLGTRAFTQALRSERRFVGISDVFSALSLVGDPLIDRLFNVFAIESGDLERALILSAERKPFGIFFRLPRTIGSFIFESYRSSRHRVVNRAWTSRPTPTLDQFSTDFTDLARRGEIGFLIGHKAEYERMTDVLSRATNPNALLVGEVGVGKETMIAHLALDLVKDRVPAALFDKRLVGLHLGTLVAGAPPDELQKRLTRIVQEISLAGNVILYIQDIHNLVKTSGSAYLSAADALMPIIMNSAFPVVGTTYPREFKEFLEPRTDVAGVFEVLNVNELSEGEAEEVLAYETLLMEKKANVIVSFGAIKQAVSLAKKYFRAKLLPSSAEELLRDAVSEAARRGENTVNAESVIRVAETKVNIPLHTADATEADTLLNMEAIIHKRFVDQDEAVTAVSNALKEYRSGLSRSGGPIATFLFVGPTGVGKTELSKVLAEIQFGSEKAMVRFDMSEYQEKESINRFIGSSGGQTTGALTDAITAHPYALVLLDEFEKAHPDILNLFLQVFDDGRLTDSLNRTVDFSNTIIVATSNAHSDIIVRAIEEGQAIGDIAEYLKKRLLDVFKPELLNRFTKIIVFKNLGPAELVKISELNLRSFAALLARKGIVFAFEEEVVRKIASLGFDPVFGARPLRRVLEEKIRVPLAEKILRKEVRRGEGVRAVLKAGEIVLVTEAGGV